MKNPEKSSVYLACIIMEPKMHTYLISKLECVNLVLQHMNHGPKLNWLVQFLHSLG